MICDKNILDPTTEWESLINASADAFLVVNSSGLICYANSAVEPLFGYQPDELIGQKVELLIPRPERERHAQIRSNYSRQPYVRDMRNPGTNTVGQRKDGSLINLDIKLSPTDFGGDKRTLAVVRDATERAAFDSLVQKKQEVLERQKRELLAAKLARERLLSIVAHDFRGPMSVLTGYSSMALNGRLGSLGSSVKQAMQAINSVASYLLEVVSDLLDVDSIEKDSVSLKTEELVLGELLQEAVNLAGLMAVPRDIKVDFTDKSESTYRLPLDRVKTLQIFGNLLSNAVKYSPDGSRVEVVLEVKDKELLVSVIDQGPGVTSKDKEKIFQRYYVSSRRPYQGSCLGLGLAIVQSLVKAQNGRVWVDESSSASGAKFCVGFPLSAQRVERAWQPLVD